MKTQTTNNQMAFNANIKLTPTVKKMVLELSPKGQNRFLQAQKWLNLLENQDELLLTRRITQDGKKVPVAINLTTGAVVAHLNHKMVKLSKATLEMLEKITNKNDRLHKQLFTKNGTLIEENINNIYTQTKELPKHPKSAYKMTPINLDDESQLMMRKYEKLCSEKELIYKLSDEEKLFIKSFDEGYIYYTCNNKNMPTGRYFTVTYNKDGFQINYDEKLLEKNLVEKYFKRYTQKCIEKSIL